MHDATEALSRELVASLTLRNTTWMKRPQVVADWTLMQAVERLSIVALPSVEIFKHIGFFAVSDPTEKPGANAQVAAIICDTGYVIRSATDFHNIIIKQCPKPISENNALEIAKQYVILSGFRYPQYACQIKILHSYEEIPLRKNEHIPRELQLLIQPPRVYLQGGDFTVHICAWSALGGELRSFNMHCAEDGGFDVEVRVLREGLGLAWLPK